MIFKPHYSIAWILSDRAFSPVKPLVRAKDYNGLARLGVPDEQSRHWRN